MLMSVIKTFFISIFSMMFSFGLFLSDIPMGIKHILYPLNVGVVLFGLYQFLKSVANYDWK